jgi:hypothetical protein
MAPAVEKRQESILNQDNGASRASFTPHTARMSYSDEAISAPIQAFSPMNYLVECAL